MEVFVVTVDADRVEKELTEVMNSQWFETGPFMIEFAEGRVPKEKLVRFSPSYCFQVDNFKRCVAAVYAKAEPRDVRELMLENLEEEHGEGDPSRDHAQLVAKVARVGRADPEGVPRRGVRRRARRAELRHRGAHAHDGVPRPDL